MPPAADEAEDSWNSDLEAKQRNLVWPDTMRNSRGVDVPFLQRGSQSPSGSEGWMLGVRHIDVLRHRDCDSGADCVQRSNVGHYGAVI